MHTIAQHNLKEIKDLTPMEVLYSSKHIPKEEALEFWSRTLEKNDENQGIFVKDRILHIIGYSTQHISSTDSIKAIGSVLKCKSEIVGVKLVEGSYSPRIWDLFCQRVIERLQISSIDIVGNSGLTNKGYESLCRLVPYNKIFKVDSQAFILEAGQSFNKFIRRNKDIEEVWLKVTYGSNEEELRLALECLQESPKLKKLSLKGGRFETLESIHITQLLRKSRLEELTLENVSFEEAGWMAIAYAVEDSALRKLSIINCGLKDGYSSPIYRKAHGLNEIVFEDMTKTWSFNVLKADILKQELSDDDSKTLLKGENDSGVDIPKSKVKVVINGVDYKKEIQLNLKFKNENPITQQLVNEISKLANEEEKECWFKLLLSKKFDIVPIDKDGNCLFSSLAYQIDGSAVGRHEMRASIVKYIKDHPEMFKPFLSGKEDGKLEAYCSKMERDRYWGGELEIVAFTHMMEGINIVVFDVNSPPKIVDGELVSPGLLNFCGSPDKPTYYLYRERQNHFDVLTPRDQMSLE